MSWSTLVGQPRVAEALSRALVTGRVAHAYLFQGPTGSGKRAAALEFAKALLCEAGGGEACDRCAPCQKAGRLVHPDLQVLLPYPADTPPEDVSERLKRLAADPYAEVGYVSRPSLSDPGKTSNKQASYPVARINDELRRSVSFKPFEGRHKVVVLTDAELLRTEAANAFLKLLEEPGPQTVFVLTTSRPERLLPTISSRCQRLRFDPLPPEAIEEALLRRGGVLAERAAPLARMADGSLTRALELGENEELLAQRGLVLDFLRNAFSRNVDGQADLVERIGRSGRENAKLLLRLQLGWLRDLLLYGASGSEALLVNVDQLEAVRRFCRNIPNADLPAMVELTEQALELIERNVGIPLVFVVLSDRLRRAMRGQKTDALYLPLTDTPIGSPA